MARSIFGGEITHLLVSEDAGNADALIVAPAATTIPLRATPGGAVQTDYLLWDGSAFTTVSSSIVTDANGHLPHFAGPDGVTVLYDALGYALYPNEAVSGGAGVTDGDKGDLTVSASGATWELNNGTVDANALADNAVTTAKLAAGAVGTTDLADAGVTSAKLNDESVMDWLATKIVSGVSTSVTYDDTASQITINTTGGGTVGLGSWYIHPTNPDVLVIPTDDEPPPAPATVPSDVATLTATSVTGSGLIDVAWTAPTSDGGSPVTGYFVYRNLPDWSNATALPATQLTQQLSNFTFGTQYTIGVRAQNANGMGPWKYVTVTPAGTVVVDPPPVVTNAAMAFPKHPIAVYHMIYTKSPAEYPLLSSIHENVNVIHLAFGLGDPANLAGYGSEGSFANMKTALNAHRAAGRRIFVSLGGGGNTLNLANRSSIISQFMAWNASIGPLDGIDFDNEGPAVNGTGSDGKYHAVYITEQLKAQRGPGFCATMAPNGTYIGQYLPVGRAMQNAGCLGAFGQQFYDTEVPDATMHSRLNEAMNTHGILASKYYLGCMIYGSGQIFGPGHYWTTDVALQRLASARAAYPGLAGAYLWEQSRSGTADWCNRVGDLINTWP